MKVRLKELLPAHAPVVIGDQLLDGTKLYLDILIQLDARGLLVGGLGKGEGNDDALFALLTADGGFKLLHHRPAHVLGLRRRA